MKNLKAENFQKAAAVKARNEKKRAEAISKENQRIARKRAETLRNDILSMFHLDGECLIILK